MKRYRRDPAQPRAAYIGPRIWGSSSEAERLRRNAFSWVARVGLGPKFGSRSIGSYQQEVVGAIEEVERRAKMYGVRADWVRATHGEVYVNGGAGRWLHLGSVSSIRAIAENRSRGGYPDRDRRRRSRRRR